jgi:hypothetical protein
MIGTSARPFWQLAKVILNDTPAARIPEARHSVAERNLDEAVHEHREPCMSGAALAEYLILLRVPRERFSISIIKLPRRIRMVSTLSGTPEA